jgi:hypothetical protein
MFIELQKSNIVAMEFPLYPLVASLPLRISSSTFGPRLISWISLVAIVTVLYRWFGTSRKDPRDIWADRAGLFIAVSLSTMMGVDFLSVQPEPMAAGLSLVAAFYLDRYRRGEVRRDAILGGVFAGLAIMTKPVVLGILPGLVLFGVWGRGRWWRRGAVVLLAFLPWLLLYFAWDRWAVRLLHQEMHDTIVISIQHDLGEMKAHLKNDAFWREALFHFIPNYAGSWWLTPALVFGIFRALAEPRLRCFAVPFVVWLAGYILELLAFGDRLHSNAYYFILAPAPVVFFCAVGLGGLFRTLESRAERPPLTAFRTGLALSVLLPLGFLYATKTTWTSIDMNNLGLAVNRATWSSDMAMARLMLGLLLAISLGSLLRPKRIPTLVGIPVLLTVLLSGALALREADQYFRYYLSIGKRGSFSSEVKALRAAVDKYSRDGDRIVTGDMLFCYYALRNGFWTQEAQTPATLANVRQRGARLYVQVDAPEGPKTAPKLKGDLLADGPWWSMYCIDPQGCLPLTRSAGRR